ncbi:Sulfate transport system permease protein [Mycobacterium marinum MB2]|nr:Sulfate transport system permease protein [Mycobacterium marinum MB2]
MRQNVCHQPEPKVAAACSWSVPNSCNTGSTSRTTNGRVTKMLARTIPGRPKMIRIPRSRSTKPRAPADPHNKINAVPTMTGETAKGRSMIACNTPLPRNRLRASSNAVGMPKITFSGTTMATNNSDRCSAEIAAGVLIQS